MVDNSKEIKGLLNNLKGMVKNLDSLKSKFPDEDQTQMNETLKNSHEAMEKFEALQKKLKDRKKDLNL